MKKYILKKKIIKIAICLLTDSAIFMIWHLLTANSALFSENAKKLSFSLMCICMLVPVWKLNVWTVISERVIEGKIIDIKKSTTANFSYTGVNPLARLPIGLSSANEKGDVYGYYIVFEDKKGKIHDVTLEYVDSAHIFPYSVGDEIISVPYTSFPQVKGKDRSVCVFCGMPVIKQDLDDRKCHYCGKDIMKNI